MAIRASRCYEPTSKAIVLANGTPLTMENMIAAGQPQEYTELVFKLCEDLAKIGSDNAEYALFTAVAIFSRKYPHLNTSPHKIQTLPMVK